VSFQSELRQQFTTLNISDEQVDHLITFLLRYSQVELEGRLASGILLLDNSYDGPKTPVAADDFNRLPPVNRVTPMGFGLNELAGITKEQAFRDRFMAVGERPPLAPLLRRGTLSFDEVGLLAPTQPMGASGFDLSIWYGMGGSILIRRGHEITAHVTFLRDGRGWTIRDSSVLRNCLELAIGPQHRSANCDLSSLVIQACLISSMRRQGLAILLVDATTPTPLGSSSLRLPKAVTLANADDLLRWTSMDGAVMIDLETQKLVDASVYLTGGGRLSSVRHAVTQFESVCGGAVVSQDGGIWLIGKSESAISVYSDNTFDASRSELKK